MYTRRLGRSFVLICVVWLMLPTQVVVAMDLEEIYELALKTDYVVRKAKAIHDGSQESVRQSKAEFLPKIAASAYYTQNAQNRTVHNFNNTALLFSQPVYPTTGYGISITQSLFDYDAITNTKQARENYELAGIEYNETSNFLILRVISAYIGILASREELRFRKSEKRAINKHLKLTKYRQKLGLSALIDVNEARARYDQTLANQTTAYIRLSIANEALRVITGQLHDSLEPLNELAPFVLPTPNDLNYWVNTAHKNNYQLQAAQQQIEIARIGVKKQRSSSYPDLSLIASYTYYDDLQLDYIGAQLETGSITARVDWNIYQGGLINSRVREAKYYQDQVGISMQQQLSLVERKIRDAYYILVGGVTRGNKLVESIKSQKVVLEANKAGYKAGEIKNIDVIRARTILYTLKRDLSQARHDHVLHHAILRYNAGVLSDEDIENINQYMQ